MVDIDCADNKVAIRLFKCVFISHISFTFPVQCYLLDIYHCFRPILSVDRYLRHDCILMRAGVFVESC